MHRLALLLSLNLLTGTLLANSYQSPDTSTRIIAAGELHLMGVERENLATYLAIYVINEILPARAQSRENTWFATRILSVALHLHPANRQALIADRAMKNNRTLDAIHTVYKPVVLSELLHTTAKRLFSKDTDSNETIGICFVALATEMNPKNRKAHLDFELLKSGKQVPDWERLTGIKTTPKK